MKLFNHDEAIEAIQYSLAGGQGLHVWKPSGDWPHAPACFKKNKTAWAHLYDQDTVRLIKTAKQLGVGHIFIHHDGSPNQHVDLCGRPLQLAQQKCEK